MNAQFIIVMHARHERVYDRYLSGRRHVEQIIEHVKVNRIEEEKRSHIHVIIKYMHIRNAGD